MKLNIQEVPAEKVTGREIRNMVNGQMQGSKDMTLQIVDVLPGAVSKPGHSHTNCEEIIYVASGEGDILISDRVWHLAPGDVVLLPRDVKHLTRNPGRETMRLICVFSSASIREGMVFDESLDYPDTGA
jgi:quercetin dioxygenase-like cupin family protein